MMKFTMMMKMMMKIVMIVMGRIHIISIIILMICSMRIMINIIRIKNMKRRQSGRKDGENDKDM
jgi:hypothetical protein